MATLRENRYGKTGVRLIKVVRKGDVHEMREWTVRVLLEGDFDDVHVRGDNAKLLTTDTLKNTVYSRANESSAESMEAFAGELSAFLLGRNPQVRAVELHIESALWKRLVVDGAPHPHAFMKGSNERATATLRRTRAGVRVRCGIEEMIVLKTAQSGFEGFMRDELTTLKETADRLFGTAIAASWNYGELSGTAKEVTVGERDYNGLRHRVREALLRTFATHDSKSVQQTLYTMAEDAMAAVAEVEEITLTMPNRHNILVDLAGFGQTNANEVFMPIEDPSGFIEARVTRA